MYIFHPPTRRLHRYTLTIQLMQLQDWVSGTSYNHFMNDRYQNVTLWKVHKLVIAAHRAP